MAPVVAAKMPGLKKWDAPLDFGKKWQGQRIFGAHKTWRGLLAGIVIAILVVAFQRFAYINWGDSIHFMSGIDSIDYQTVNIWILGTLMGIGALLGDAVKSSFKRRRGVKPGHTWLPFDQIDYIIGGLLLTYPLVRPSFSLILSVFAVYFGLHLAVVYVFYKLGVRDKPV